MIRRFLSFLLGCFLLKEVNSYQQVNQQVTYVGRWDLNGEITGYPAAQWPGSQVSFHVETTKEGRCTVTIELTGCVDDCHYFVDVEARNVMKDGSSPNVHEVIEISPSKSSIAIQFKSESTAYGYSTWYIQLTKLTEGSYSDAKGMFSIIDISVDGGKIKDQDSVQDIDKSFTSVLFIGDSITAAYGVEGDADCAFQASYESIQRSYAWLSAKATNTEATYIAFSGKGVVRNYGDIQSTSADPMPLYYNRTLVDVIDPYWDPSQHPIPSIVSIALGANDYSTEPNPSDDDFIDNYLNLIDQIHQDYPTAKILCICEPMPNGKQEANIKSVAAKANVEYLRIGDDVYDYGFGCDGHPSTNTQNAIASNYVIPKLREMLHEEK